VPIYAIFGLIFSRTVSRREKYALLVMVRGGANEIKEKGREEEGWRGQSVPGAYANPAKHSGDPIGSKIWPVIDLVRISIANGFRAV
jgi:hypothetical protein